MMLRKRLPYADTTRASFGRARPVRIPYRSLTTGFVRKRALSPRRLQSMSGSFMSASKQGSPLALQPSKSSRCRTLTLRDMAKDAFLVPESVPDGAELNRPEPTGGMEEGGSGPTGRRSTLLQNRGLQVRVLPPL